MINLEKIEIDKCIKEIFSRYKGKVGNVALPVDERVLVNVIEDLKGLKIQLIERKEKSVYQGFNEGVLIPVKGGFILQYGINPIVKGDRIFSPIRRRRFTICHELAHILFYDCSDTVPKLTVHPPEHICHRIAREMLLPTDCVIQKFQAEYRPDINLIPFLKKFANDAKVNLYPLVIRLMEDLSLLNGVMVTFWRKYQSKSEICYKNYRIDSKLGSELRKHLSYYWRHKIYLKAWNEVVKDVAKDQNPRKKPNLMVRGKRKTIIFDIECEPWKRTLSTFLRIPDHLLSAQKFIRIEGE